MIAEEIGGIGADAPRGALRERPVVEESENYPSVGDIDCPEGARREVNRG